MNSLDIYDILKHLPHRYPFLLIDRVVDYEPGKSLVAIKNVTHNEPHFPGHFPNRPIMPGVLILEALAQATGILAFKTADRIPDENSLYYFVGVDNDDVIAGIDMRGIDRFVLATQAAGNLGRQAAQIFPFRVNYIPVTIHFVRLG